MSDRLVFRKTIVDFLRTDDMDLFEGRNEEEWRKNLRWLDRSGLALSLAARFEALQSGAAVPSGVRTTLHTRLLDNQSRMQRMLEFFQEANQALAASGARYSSVKGFSLIPDCFQCIRERHQVDLDFLIAPQDLQRAQSAIEALGYRVQFAGDSGEVRLIQSWKKHLGVNAYLYQLPEPPPIELHTAVWESEADEIEFPMLSGFLDAIDIHEICGVEFPCLRPARQFVYLLLHVFRHLLGSWARLLSLYEIAAFIRARSAESELWTEAGQIIGKDKYLASACALVLGLVDSAFPLEMPPSLRAVYARNLSTDSALWIERCSTAWLFADPPGNKLALLVQRQFRLDRHSWRRYLLRRLLPLRKPPELSDEVVISARKSLAYRAEETWYKASRAWYHLRSDGEYLIARLRWARLRQTRAGSIHRIIGGC
jgi:hypothetical protein